MTDQPPRESRRDFLKWTGTALGGAWLAAHMGQVHAAAAAARELGAAGAPFKNIDPDRGRALAAVADQIYPPDDTPGAAELGAVHFMDWAVGAFMAGAWPMIQAGLADLNRRAKEVAGGTFDRLSFDEQTRILSQVEDTPFFGTVHFLTLLGCFSLPDYGGNRDGAGWAQIGFESRHHWLPPFGHYDAGYGAVAGAVGDNANGEANHAGA